jgi:hypothetical protein
VKILQWFNSLLPNGSQYPEVSREYPLPTRAYDSKAQPSVTFARPANTSAYTAKNAVTALDAASVALEFTGAAWSAGGGGEITNAVLHTSDTTNIPRLRLHLFSGPPSVVSNDRNAFVIAAADKPLHLGWIDFGPPQLEGTGSEYATSQALTAKDFRCAATTLYGRLETLEAIAAAVSGAVYTIQLSIAGRH